MKEEEKLAIIRAEVIMKVQMGELTATEAAAQLGVSRKTYYEWQERWLQATLKSLSNKAPGRPKKEVNPEVTRLQKEIKQLKEEKSLLKMHLEIKEILEDLSEEDRRSILEGKKTRNQRKRNRKKKAKQKPNRK